MGLKFWLNLIFDTFKRKNARKEYASIIDNQRILQDDICFGSPSYVAMFICGKSSNGLMEWKNKQGISLKELDITETTIPNVPSTIQPKISSSLSEKAKNDNIKNMLHLAGKKQKLLLISLIVSLLYAKTLNSVPLKPHHALSISMNVVKN